MIDDLMVSFDLDLNQSHQVLAAFSRLKKKYYYYLVLSLYYVCTVVKLQVTSVVLRPVNLAFYPVSGTPGKYRYAWRLVPATLPGIRYTTLRLLNN